MPSPSGDQKNQYFLLSTESAIIQKYLQKIQILTSMNCDRRSSPPPFCICVWVQVWVILVPREEISFGARPLLASTPSNAVYELKKVRYHLHEQY